MKTNAQPQYLGDAIVLDRAEFARLIRQYAGLKVTVFAEDYNAVAKCQSACFGFKIPAKVALEQLARCDFDAFEWKTGEFGPCVWYYTAPMHVQLQRRRDFLIARLPLAVARIAEIEQRLALVALAEHREWRQKIHDSEVEQVASDRAEIVRLDAQIPTARAQAAA